MNGTGRLHRLTTVAASSSTQTKIPYWLILRGSRPLFNKSEVSLLVDPTRFETPIQDPGSITFEVSLLVDSTRFKTPVQCRSPIFSKAPYIYIYIMYVEKPHSSIMVRQEHYRIVSLSERKQIISTYLNSASRKEFRVFTSKLYSDIKPRTINRIIERFLETGDYTNRRKSGRKRNFVEDHEEFLNLTLTANDECNLTKLQHLFESELGAAFSRPTIRRHRKKLGWLCTKTKYGQLIRKNNRAARLAFAITALEQEIDFNNVIFADECTVYLENNSAIHFRRANVQSKKKGKPKHQAKVSAQLIIQ